MRTLGVIAARGGSKGVVRKNLTVISDIPLMEFTRRAAVGSHLDRLIVSTDDSEIARVARNIEIEVPFMRPAKLATDSAPLQATLVHAIKQLAEEGDEFDAVISLDITAPFKLSTDIDNCIDRIENGASSANTVSEVEINPYYNMLRVGDGGWAEPLFEEYFTLTRRQDAPVVYRENAIVQAATVENVLAGNWPVTDRCALIMIPPSRSIMIDSVEDLILVRALAEEFIAENYPEY